MRLDHEQKMSLTRFAADLIKAVACTDEPEFDEACHANGIDFGKLDAILWTMIDMGRRQASGNGTDGTGAPIPWPQWKIDLLGEVVDTSHPSPGHVTEMVARLDDCVMAIPLSAQYAHLIREYSGEWPRDKRVGRPDDIPNHAGDHDEMVNSAMAFLREPSRRTYVLTGNDDFGSEMGDETRTMLKAMQVHVKADMARFDPKALMSMEGVTPKHIAQIYRAGMLAET